MRDKDRILAVYDAVKGYSEDHIIFDLRSLNPDEQETLLAGLLSAFQELHALYTTANAYRLQRRNAMGLPEHYFCQLVQDLQHAIDTEPERLFTHFDTPALAALREAFASAADARAREDKNDPEASDAGPATP